MKFRMSVEDANSLYACARAASLSKHEIEKFRTIQCHIEREILTAQFIGKYMGTEFQCVVGDVEPASGDFWLVPPPKKFNLKKDINVSVEVDDQQTAYITAQGTQSFQIPDFLNEKFNMDHLFCDQPESKIYYDPKILSDALSAFFDCDDIKIEFLGEKHGIVIHGRKQHKRTFVVPVNDSW